jgi:hypothetical protein
MAEHKYGYAWFAGSESVGMRDLFKFCDREKVNTVHHLLGIDVSGKMYIHVIGL